MNHRIIANTARMLLSCSCRDRKGDISVRTLVIIIATLIGLFILAVLFFKSFEVLK